MLKRDSLVEQINNYNLCLLWHILGGLHWRYVIIFSSLLPDFKYFRLLKSNQILSYEVAVIQWIMSCNKNHMTTRVITLWRVDVTSLTTSVSIMRFLLEILSSLKALKSNFKGSNNKQNLTLMVILYEIYQTRRRLVSELSYEMTIRVRFSISVRISLLRRLKQTDQHIGNRWLKYAPFFISITVELQWPEH